jgi:WS/DGAT/MGAT family acyltransferase
VAYARAPLADVKLISSFFGTTVNHVVLAACTRALRNYLEIHGGVPDAPLVAAIPVSLRSPKDVESSGNQVSAYLVRIPVHLDDPVEQLLFVREEAESSKLLHARLDIASLAKWAEFAPAALLGRAARFYSDRELAGRHRPLHNLVISNIQGPRTPLYAAGARLTAAYPLGPLMEGTGINITVVSYLDSIDFGVIACERSVPHVAELALGFGAAVADLHKIALEDVRSAPPSTRRKQAVRGAASPAAAEH